MKEETTYLINKLIRQIKICSSLMVFVIIVTGFILYNDSFSSDAKELAEITLQPIDAMYDISLVPTAEKNKELKYGYELFTSTTTYIGPASSNEEMRYAGNNLACNNCHLQAGTKPYAAPLIGIINRFPQFRGRENKIGTIEERINGCFERSMNGKTIPTNGKEMKAFVAYLNWLSRFSSEDGKVFGQGFMKIKIPNRKVDLENGKRVFNTICIECHQSNGLGEKTPNEFVYKYPPLWGSDSYNNGAGMTRVLTAAQFIKANMPFGATYDNPILTDTEAYDVAGYINQQKRPQKKNKELDFPNLKRKPVSTPYPPYADSFSIQQHQLGPFKPIIEYYKREFNINKSK